MLRVLSESRPRSCWPSSSAGVLLYPFMEGSGGGRALFSVFGILVLGLVVLAVRSSPALTWVSLLLGVPATVLLLIQAVTDARRAAPYSSRARGGPVLLRRLRADPLHARRPRDHARRAVRGRRDVHARGLGLRLRLRRLAGDRARQLHRRASTRTAERTWMELLFLSFTTLSSTGLSDVVPVEAFARSLVMIEQLAGVAYIAVVVSRLVALTIPRPRA